MASATITPLDAMTMIPTVSVIKAPTFNSYVASVFLCCIDLCFRHFAGNPPYHDGRRSTLAPAAHLEIWKNAPILSGHPSLIHGDNSHALTALPLYEGLGGNEKLPPRRFPRVGIVPEISGASTQLPPQKSSPWWSVCPPLWRQFNECPNRKHGRPSAGVG